MQRVSRSTNIEEQKLGGGDGRSYSETYLVEHWYNLHSPVLRDMENGYRLSLYALTGVHEQDGALTRC